MILLREVEERDLEGLERLAQIPGFINLQNDRDFLKDRIVRSRASFAEQIKHRPDAKYVFVAEDTDTGAVMATSTIAAQHGTADSPHFYFEVDSEEKFSSTINTGFIHGTLKLRYDTNGPSEIGGLVVDPGFRNSEARLGRQISFVRFLYIGLHKNRFKKKIIAELLPPLNKKGQSPLWEAIGRRFTNMDYMEADHLCRKNKEFIFSLFPSGKIYTAFLPAEARNAIGKVGQDTEHVLHMLKKIGFTYRNQVDPFDGGPHLWANIDDLLPIKKLAQGTFSFQGARDSEGNLEMGLLTKAGQVGEPFRAVAARGCIERSKFLYSRKNEAALKDLLKLKEGDRVAFMPYY